MAIGVAVNLFAAHHQARHRAAACRPAQPRYGRPPGGLRYRPASDRLRRRTLRALRVDPGADLQLVQRDGVVYGEVVGVATPDPRGYVAGVVSEARKVTGGPGYSLIPYGARKVVALGARGCRAVYVAAATPDDVKRLAAAVISG